MFSSLACKSDKASQTGSGEATASRAAVQFVAGAAAPAFEYPNLAKEKKALSDFRGKNVLLNFWATWCVPCVSEMGALERLYKTYRDRGFEIVAVNVDPVENDEAVRNFVKENGITFTVLRDPELALPEVYGLTGFPESFFISRDGKFLNFSDPSTSEKEVRIVGDRAWDSVSFLKAVEEVFPKS